DHRRGRGPGLRRHRVAGPVRSGEDRARDNPQDQRRYQHGARGSDAQGQAGADRLCGRGLLARGAGKAAEGGNRQMERRHQVDRRQDRLAVAAVKIAPTPTPAPAASCRSRRTPSTWRQRPRQGALIPPGNEVNLAMNVALALLLADFSRARDSQITFSLTHGWSGFWSGRPWLGGHRIGETSSDVGSSRFWIGWVTKHGDKCARSTCRG